MGISYTAYSITATYKKLFGKQLKGFPPSPAARDVQHKNYLSATTIEVQTLLMPTEKCHASLSTAPVIFI